MSPNLDQKYDGSLCWWPAAFYEPQFYSCTVNVHHNRWHPKCHPHNDDHPLQSSFLWKRILRPQSCRTTTISFWYLSIDFRRLWHSSHVGMVFCKILGWTFLKLAVTSKLCWKSTLRKSLRLCFLFWWLLEVEVHSISDPPSSTI